MEGVGRALYALTFNFGLFLKGLKLSFWASGHRAVKAKLPG